MSSLSVSRSGPPPRPPTLRERLATYRQRAVVGSFQFEVRDSFQYEDRHPHVVGNSLVSWTAYQPHLILLDREGRERFALGYRSVDGEIQIDPLQRLRNFYRPARGYCETLFREIEGMEWHRSRETKEGHRFARDLGGTHAGEFTLLEFLHRHLDRLNENPAAIRLRAYHGRGEGPIAYYLQYFGDLSTVRQETGGYSFAFHLA